MMTFEVRTTIVVLILCTATALAQPDQPDMTLDATARNAMIEGVLTTLETSYVIPETARKMASEIRARA